MIVPFFNYFLNVLQFHIKKGLQLIFSIITGSSILIILHQPSQLPSYMFVSCLLQQETLFFIKQIESLGNACGTIALLHAVGNAYSEISLLGNSCLDLFVKSTFGMTSYERAMFLEKDDDMVRAHSLAASAGETKLSDVVEEHYICFVECNGTLYELDGMKPGPIKHGSSSPKSLLQVLKFCVLGSAAATAMSANRP
ncbi:hypothetical protein E2562_005106 [Oryza meyeriana var. granulata]|uniref:Ubiquitin carboxyl-terminal hydrolase n=1 Tax=Oryza meyeriana var. granulata TaxID=110450 RepID=A0A6G1BSQ4_9ORYZ|nr:hypothetical protein E2562_005106 [Oryza meyeriana var. granulata]KAF0891005.1 hypothetical protein E2562_005106 [Oryza meyeriana var. granulata]KAF0891006.1 hypothetical protein E2562_005106 [Oryza meyeriana var. granulata]KAF0891007.1 hypothetical protein E2562_005106 [Oryza meyeriana var. granulata]KAF0891009.1 hypothetical protein E2562_005106 [Oryza meyeriana var. granulata]